MWILKFHGRDELDHMKVSKYPVLLQEYASKEIEGKLSYESVGDILFIYSKGEEIGVIGKIEEIELPY